MRGREEEDMVFPQGSSVNALPASLSLPLLKPHLVGSYEALDGI